VAPWVVNFLFETVNFLLLVGALGWLFFKPVGAALDAERKHWEAVDLRFTVNSLSEKKVAQLRN